MEIRIEDVRFGPGAPKEQRPGLMTLAGGLWMSLRSAGDCGPSGFRGAARHREVSGLCGLDGQAVYIPTQVHSRRIVVLESGRPAGLWACTALTGGGWAISATDCLGPEVPTVYDESSMGDVWSWTSRQEADGILSDLPLVLGATGADCLVIALAWGKWRGMLHSGWQGTGILAGALEKLAGKSHGVTADCYITFCPSIAASDYPVPQERAQLFASLHGADYVTILGDGQPCLDIIGANTAMVRDFARRRLAGTVQLTRFMDSTASTPWLHSYRRDGQAFGRMVAIQAPLVP